MSTSTGSVRGTVRNDHGRRWCRPSRRSAAAGRGVDPCARRSTAQHDGIRAPSPRRCPVTELTDRLRAVPGPRHGAVGRRRRRRYAGTHDLDRERRPMSRQRGALADQQPPRAAVRWCSTVPTVRFPPARHFTMRPTQYLPPSPWRGRAPLEAKAPHAARRGPGRGGRSVASRRAGAVVHSTLRPAWCSAPAPTGRGRVHPVSAIQAEKSRGIESVAEAPE